MKRCLICEKNISHIPKAKKYCSAGCRAKAKYKKDRAWLAAHPGKASEYSRNWYNNNLEAGRQIGHDKYKKKCIERLKEGSK
ncbi:hypothetical protein LJB90_03685 [Eubacteriales bacterium OttesenSCG-928-G02]|nr:hypothetical protein [Eubacteriales bacterium OttesenSCG-928-G02]